MIVSDWLNRQAEFEKEVGGYFRAGKIKTKTVVQELIMLWTRSSAFFMDKTWARWWLSWHKEGIV